MLDFLVLGNFFRQEMISTLKYLKYYKIYYLIKMQQTLRTNYMC